jgi:2'-5' RNA ligase
MRLKAHVVGHALRLVHSDHLHLTLAFIGEVSGERGRVIADVIKPAIDRDPFEIVFDGIGVFPPEGAPRILWLGVTAGLEAAVALQREVADRLEAVGVKREDRPYSPHLTLARWRDGKRSDARWVLDERIGMVARVPVRDIALYESQLSPSGPRYTVLLRAPLVARPH